MSAVISIPGIKQIAKCNAGTLLTTPTGIALCGIRDKATMNFTPYKADKDIKGRQGRNMVQAAVDYEMMQPTMKYFNSLFTHMNLNCDVQVMTEKQSFTAGSEDVLQFTPSSFQLGLGFEYLINMNRRSIKETLKGAATFATVQTLIDGASSATEVALTGGGNVSGEDETLRRPVNFLAIEVPTSTTLYAPGELEDFKASIKGLSAENGTGQLLIDWIEYNIEITMRNAAIAKIAELLAKDINASCLIKLGNSGAYYDAFQFNAGAVNNFVVPDFEDKRISKLTLAGKVRPYEHLFQTGAAYGGIAADNGLNGGTLVIG
jgi:hypothetical protein